MTAKTMTPGSSPGDGRRRALTTASGGPFTWEMPRQHGSTLDFIFPIPRLLAHITAAMTLEPGDLVLTRRIFELIGKAYVLDEKHLDAVTGLSGDWGKSLKAYLACGITTVNVMPGSGHLSSGQTLYLKLRDGDKIDDFLIMADGRIAGGLKGGEAVVLGDAPAQCVVVEPHRLGGSLRAVGAVAGAPSMHREQAMVVVPFEALDGVAGDALFDQA